MLDLQAIIENDIFQLEALGKTLKEYIDFLNRLTPNQITRLEEGARKSYRYDMPLQILLDLEGFENMDEFIVERGFDSVVPAICRNCKATYEMEPDCHDGHCTTCGEDKVDSILILGGMI